MADQPGPLNDATSGQPSPPVPSVDHEVNFGSALQLIAAGIGLAIQVASSTDPPRGRTHLDKLFNGGGLCLIYPALSAVAFAGSLRHNASRRRTLHGIYLSGLATVMGVPMAVGTLWPRQVSDPAHIRWGLPFVLLVVNPAAVWITGRWLLFLVFPSMGPAPRPEPRGFAVIGGSNDDDRVRPPLDVGQITLRKPVTTADIVAAVREGRDRG